MSDINIDPDSRAWWVMDFETGEVLEKPVRTILTYKYIPGSPIHWAICISVLGHFGDPCVLCGVKGWIDEARRVWRAYLCSLPDDLARKEFARNSEGALPID